MNAETYVCHGNEIKLHSGKYLNLVDPQPDQFDLEDIAVPLGRICRFGGHCKTFYSVAEHSWHCYDVGRKDGLPLDSLRALLMHDATEAFIGDVVRPLKAMLPDYRHVEKRLESVIAARFLIDFDSHAELIREIDLAVLLAERRKLFEPDEVIWSGQDEARDVRINLMFLSPVMAAQTFGQTANSLGIFD